VRGIPLSAFKDWDLTQQFSQFYATDKGKMQKQITAQRRKENKRFVPWYESAEWTKRDDYGKKSA
jgi:hypothetical protein